jgi:hypothetical protein
MEMQTTNVSPPVTLASGATVMLAVGGEAAVAGWETVVLAGTIATAVVGVSGFNIVTTVRALLIVTSLVPMKVSANVSDILLSSSSSFWTVAISTHCGRLTDLSISMVG